MTEADVLAVARRWAEAWRAAWRTHDVELLRPFYAEDVEFRSQPFREPQAPADYAAWAFQDEAEARVWFAEPRVVGTDRAAVEYWGVSIPRHGTTETIAGVALLRFGPDGRVVEQRDYWNAAEGAVEPYEGWGSGG
ncbi:MAG TPA: nuclear transport factor 2 family protein [Actinomycetota bacterium]|jgi:SnoaL-like domain|nr:nuclear transport factor 2 family protein [Actinomycetota bacterium]